MTINDIMLRDIAEAEKIERERKAENEMAEYDRKVERWLRRRRLKALGDIAAGILTLAAFALLAWLFLAATPEQYSAECEALRAEMETQGK